MKQEINDIINQEVTTLENERAELMQIHFVNQSKIAELNMAKMDIIKNNIGIQKDLSKINIKIGQLRRKFKIDGYRKTASLRMSADAKDLFLSMKGRVCEEEGCGSKEDITVHHIKPLSHGGTNELENLQVLCIQCHRKYHRI